MSAARAWQEPTRSALWWQVRVSGVPALVEALQQAMARR
jgi:hypothetical protein